MNLLISFLVSSLDSALRYQIQLEYDALLKIGLRWQHDLQKHVPILSWPAQVQSAQSAITPPKPDFDEEEDVEAVELMLAPEDLDLDDRYADFLDESRTHQEEDEVDQLVNRLQHLAKIAPT